MVLHTYQYQKIILPLYYINGERWPYHVFHTDADLSITVKSPIEAHYVGRVAFMKDLQLSDDLIPYCWLDL